MEKIYNRYDGSRYSLLAIRTICGQYVAACISTIMIIPMTWHDPEALWAIGASIGVLLASLPVDSLLGILLFRKPQWICPIVTLLILNRTIAVCYYVAIFHESLKLSQQYGMAFAAISFRSLSFVLYIVLSTSYHW